MPIDLSCTDAFARRHIGPDERGIEQMLQTVNAPSFEAFLRSVVPEVVRSPRPLQIDTNFGEYELLAELRRIAAKNKIHRSYIGMGYHDTITPPVIQRNILENPGWYTQYTLIKLRSRKAV
jgi:glycine dehydrogenase